MDYLTTLKVRVQQRDQSDCGVAALASVAKYFGVESSMATLRHMSGSDAAGTTIKGIVDAANSLGLEGAAYKGDFTALSSIELPAILYTKKEGGLWHFIVLYNIDGERYRVMDPTDGAFHSYTKEELNGIWSGVLIIFNREREVSSSFKIPPYMKFLLRESRGRWRLYLFNTSISLIGAVAIVAVALFVKELFDVVIPSGEVDKLLSLSLYLGAALFISLVLTAIKGRVVIGRGVAMERELSRDLLKHLTSIPYPLFSTFTTGELTSRVGEVNSIRRVVIETLSNLIFSLITIFIAVIIMFYLESNLAKMVILFTPLYLAIFAFTDRVGRPTIRELMESSALFQGTVVQYLKGMSSVKNFSLEESFITSSMAHYNKMVKAMLRSANITIGAFVSSQFLSKLITVTVVWFGGGRVMAGELTVGELVAFYTVISLFTEPIQQLVGSFWQVREGVTGASRYWDVMGIEPEKSLLPISGKATAPIEVRELSFGYSGKAKLFENLSFTVEKGKLTLIKGRNGSGKSTLVLLLMRHLTEEGGEIASSLVKGREIKEWRELIALVPQEPTIIGETIIESIVPHGVERGREEHFVTVTKELEIDLMSERFPLGLLSNPGENGSLLSRGEQQRISYARALMKGSPILILDEPTASLDLHSKGLITNSLRRLKMEGATIIVVSHEEWITDLADSVVELDHYAPNYYRDKILEGAHSG